jgi:hypothetical protein
MAPRSPDLDRDELGRALLLISRLSNLNLGAWIGGLENINSGASGAIVAQKLAEQNIDEELLAAAILVKRSAGQVNVLIHAIGILVALPKILAPGEVVESLSLGAGNTGRAHDLETNRQIAEFKFIDWRGGAESIRQNGLFGDIFSLASEPTTKRRVIYLTGTAIPLRFLENRRALSSVLKDAPLGRRFRELHGERFATVRDYWLTVRDQVEIVDLVPLIPAFAP